MDKNKKSFDEINVIGNQSTLLDAIIYSKKLDTKKLKLKNKIQLLEFSDFEDEEELKDIVSEGLLTIQNLMLAQIGFFYFKKIGVGTPLKYYTKLINQEGVNESIDGRINALINRVNIELVKNAYYPTRNIKTVLFEKADMAERDIRKLARTETTNVVGQNNMQTMLAYDIKKYRFVATLDSHTTPICQRLDSKVFDVKEAEVGVNYPPMLANCRSTTIGVINNNTRRLARDKNKKNIEVDASMDYTTYKQKYLS